jgi:hypothetical protein
MSPHYCKSLVDASGAPWHGEPIRPFGPTEGFFKGNKSIENAAKCRNPCTSQNLSCKQGFEAFNPINFLSFVYYKKFLEVQKPFFKKVFGLRGQK